MSMNARDMRPARPELFTTIKMSEGDYQSYLDTGTGVCMECGETKGCCEPDARRYRCEDCGLLAVYGVEWLMVSGRIEIGSAGGDVK